MSPFSFITQINILVSVADALYSNSEAVIDPITPETVATDAESVEPLSVDDKQAIDNLIEITESDEDLCIVTVENDCINETVE